MAVSNRDRFLELLRAAVHDGTLHKLTLGKYRGPDATVRNVFVQPVTLKAGPHLAFVWRHTNRDVTKNLAPAEALADIERRLGTEFLDGHLFTATQQAQLETQPDGSARVRVRAASAPATPAPGATQRQPETAAAPSAHDATKQYLIPRDAGWLRALGVTNDRGQPREGMSDKFRQIQRFAELLSHLVRSPAGEAPAADDAPLLVADMGSGKGYLTFATAALLGERARVRGIEARSELVRLCNRIAAEHGFGERLTFEAGTINEATLGRLDVLIALHACDTATDDAIARGINAGARLIVVAPCCQKELRRQLTAPAVLADALRHGIFQERQAEFVTDALRAQLLEWAGYRTKVFEFISTEHTAKNVMIAAEKTELSDERRAATLERLRAFAAFYGIRTHALARHLGVELGEEKPFVPAE